MRAGVVISVVTHCVLVALALLGTPKLFDSVPLAAIEVDLVRPEEVELPKEQPPEEKKEKPAPYNPLPEASAPPQPVAPAPAPEVAAPNPPPKPPTQAQNQQALGPKIPSQPAPAPSQSTTPWIFDPVNIPALLDLPNAPEKGFDAEATTMASLSSEERAAFKDHLKKCWKLPDGMSAAQTTRVVMRIYLNRNGTLAGDPILIEASASREGPLMLQAAIRTLKACEPYSFLPADRYREWKALDLSFSPREMAGG